MIDRDPDIALRYKKGKAAAIGAVAQGLLQKARSGDTTSAIFYLKTQAGWRETDAQSSYDAAPSLSVVINQAPPVSAVRVTQSDG